MSADAVCALSKDYVMSSKKLKAKNIHEANEFKNIPIGEIDFSPLNYRKFFSTDDLENFAKELAQHGIISPLTVRLLPSGRYELVAGERRLRAARIAGLHQVPVVVRSLSDEDVIELQLAENIQRENPHPMEEAQAIGQMLNIRKTIEEIAGRLGKSKQFVYTRLKLLSLIEPVQEMFLADKISLQQAVEIAALSGDSQTDLFEEECGEWKTDPDFALDDLSYLLRRYKYNLNEAPFSIKDRKLLPEVGACTNCSFNSATLNTLFPEYAKEAVCSNTKCFQTKCAAHFVNELKKLIRREQPSALLFYGQPTAAMQELLDVVPEANDLIKHLYYDVSVMWPPRQPDATDYEDDEEGYRHATEEYQSEVELYQQEIEAGNYQKGILISNHQLESVWFNTQKASGQDHHPFSKVTAKEVEEAIKSGSATVDMLQSALQKIHYRENRAQELDREKVQQQVHERFLAHISNSDTNVESIPGDRHAALLLIYEALNWSEKKQVDEMLFSNGERDVYESICKLTEQQAAFLIRTAVASKTESKIFTHSCGKCLYGLASEIGVHVAEIEGNQAKVALQRMQRYEKKVAELEKRIHDMQPAIV
jgi:ParB family transcriptional regulator, chromosome partitioning protein